jgi:predicted nucleotidyltransferase
MKAIRSSSQKEIKKLCEQIAREYRPQKIILFGSHAYGKPQWDSDVDLLVIMPFKGRYTSKAIEILNRLNPTTTLDLLVRTPQQVEKRLAMDDFFMREIIERGKVMYEADHS